MWYALFILVCICNEFQTRLQFCIILIVCSLPCAHVLLFTPDCSVLELYLRGRGGQELRGALIRSQTSHDSLSSVWSELLPQCVNILLTQLYTVVCVFCYTLLYEAVS